MPTRAAGSTKVPPPLLAELLGLRIFMWCRFQVAPVDSAIRRLATLSLSLSKHARLVHTERRKRRQQLWRRCSFFKVSPSSPLPSHSPPPFSPDLITRVSNCVSCKSALSTQSTRDPAATPPPMGSHTKRTQKEHLRASVLCTRRDMSSFLLSFFACFPSGITFLFLLSFLCGPFFVSFLVFSSCPFCAYFVAPCFPLCVLCPPFHGFCLRYLRFLVFFVYHISLRAFFFSLSFSPPPFRSMSLLSLTVSPVSSFLPPPSSSLYLDSDSDLYLLPVTCYLLPLFDLCFDLF